MDIRSVLAFPAAYSWFRRLVGRDSARHAYAERYIRAHAGCRVLDIGCGTGDMLDFLGDVEYVGCDINEDYIEAARRRHGLRGTFFCSAIGEGALTEMNGFDVVIAHGVLHHLDDAEALCLFSVARKALCAAGRLVTFDGCFTDDQSMLSRFFVSQDRGRHVRRPEAYQGLAMVHFSRVDMTIRHDMIRIPYTHIIMECTA